MLRGIFLFLLGSLLVVIGAIAIFSITEAIIQWAAGNGDGPKNRICPAAEGYACSYEEKVMAKWWAPPFLVVGSVFALVGIRRLMAEGQTKVLSE